MIEFGRDICGDADQALRREWLVTNGLGGYAAGTIAGANTRRYHGLLIAALNPPAGRTLLLSKLDAIAHLRHVSFGLEANEWVDGSIDPPGYALLESFRLDGSIPTWTYALAEAQLIKRVSMAHGHNTTFITYTHARGGDPIDLDLTALCTYRDHHQETKGNWLPMIQSMPDGIRVQAFDQAVPYFIKIDRGDFTPIERWYWNFKHRIETERGLDDAEDLWAAGVFHARLLPGETICSVASIEEGASLDWSAAWQSERDRERSIIENSGLSDQPPWIQQLGFAADQFIVARSIHSPISNLQSPIFKSGHTVIAGYHWFGDWGRDTMIALPGLCLITKRYDAARSILKTFAAHVDRGMLPNRFPDRGETPEYNTVDATLWYFHAIDQTVKASGDFDLARELYPVLKDIVDWHVNGTRYNIHVDRDSLLYAGEAGVQLTWMDAKVGDWVVTPRIGKPVEINALWIHALRIMARFAQQLRLTDEAQKYSALADKAVGAFRNRFWFAEGGYLYDVIDTSNGDDQSLRPNQLIAVALEPDLLSIDRARSVVDICARELLTSFGLRSLTSVDGAYIGHYAGDQINRDGAYHQGTVWAWLIGPFVQAHFNVYHDRSIARSFLLPFEQHLQDAGLGSISEIFEGDPPHLPKGCAAQAWSVAEVLRGWMMMTGER